ncbi:MAG: sensor histidine kinase [Anaerolineae bacterium]
MKPEWRRWLHSRRPQLPSFRFLFTLMYLGVIGAIAYSNTILNCGRKLLGGGAGVLMVLLLLLVGLEQLEHWRYRYEAPLPVAVALLLARMILFEGVGALDCSVLSILLYPIIPFSAFFAFGARFGALLSVFYAGVALAKTWLHNPHWYTSPMSVFIVIAFLLLLIFMQVLAGAIRRDEESRHRTERLLSDLETSHRKLQAYAEEVAELAATEERNRLARDIHDSVGHALTAVNIQLEKALAYWQRSPEEALQAIRDAKQAASEALRDVRSSVAALRDADERFSLQASLQTLAERMRAQGLAVNLTITGDERDYSRATLMALYRAAQEGLTNVQRHADASRVEIELSFGEREVRLRLRDNGRGFDPRTAEMASGFGLQGIRERLELVLGRLEIKSDPACGTELVMTAPRQPIVLAQ